MYVHCSYTVIVMVLQVTCISLNRKLEQLVLNTQRLFEALIGKLNSVSKLDGVRDRFLT